MTAKSDVIELLSKEPAAAGLFTDYDGTLAPVVADPELARPLPEALVAISRLATSLGRVAVVSGRPAAWLGDRFAAVGHGIELYGLHGLEHMTAAGVVPLDRAAGWVPVVAVAVAAAESEAIDGLVVEDKTYSFTLHWRGAPDPALVSGRAVVLARRLAAEHGFELRPGKASVELVPPLGIDKGTVVRDRAVGLGTLAFFGDDLGDLAAFAALDEIEREGKGVARVAVSSPEAPEELLARADLVLADPEEAAGLLSQLARRVSGP